MKMTGVPMKCILELQIRHWKVDRNFVGCDVDVLYYYSGKLLIYYFMICKIKLFDMKFTAEKTRTAQELV